MQCPAEAQSSCVCSEASGGLPQGSLKTKELGFCFMGHTWLTPGTSLSFQTSHVLEGSRLVGLRDNMWSQGSISGQPRSRQVPYLRDNLSSYKTNDFCLHGGSQEGTVALRLVSHPSAFPKRRQA